MRRISLSSDTFQRRVSSMLEDVKDQVMNASPVLSFQVDNSTDVSSCAQLLVFVRYIHSGDNIEEFPSCKCFLILQSCSGNVCGVCTHGVLAMMGSRSGFQKRFNNFLLKQKVHTVSFVHVCVLAELFLVL